MQVHGARRPTSLAAGGLLVALVLLAGSPAAAIQGGTKKVDCGNGGTIAHALQEADANPISIVVMGSCNENVVIGRDDVTLLADPAGGTVSGSDPNSNTITVLASRAVIDGLTVTGGLNGIVGAGAGRLTVRNCTVQNTGRNGISFFQGSDGTVDNCTVQNNARHGLTVEGGSATIVNSTISGNAETGILLFNSGSARIGITNRNPYAGNTISGNQSNGIHVAYGGSAAIGGNTISGNGTNAGAIFGRFGIAFFQAGGAVVGNNTISGNAGSGIFARSASVLIGDPGFNLPTANTITGNGAAGPTNGGIFGFLGSALDIRDAMISSNTGNGVTLSTRSSARMFNDTITSNGGHGILLTLGGGLLLQTPAVMVTGNGGFGLQCTDAESSFAGNTTGIGVNVAGSISPTCTGF